MSGRLEGKVALVTGAARGIGRALAIGLAAEGSGAPPRRDLDDPRAVLAELPESGRGLFTALCDVLGRGADPGHLLDPRPSRRAPQLRFGVTGWMDAVDPSARRRGTA